MRLASSNVRDTPTLLSELKTVVSRVPETTPDIQSLLHTRDLCRRIGLACDDGYVNDLASRIEQLAQDWFFTDRHATWTRGTMLGGDVLQNKIGRLVGALEARVATRR